MENDCCSTARRKEEIIVRLFYNASSSFQLLFLFFYLTSLFLSNFLSAIPPRNQEDQDYYDDQYATFEEEEKLDDDDHLGLLQTSTTTSSCQNSVVFDDELEEHHLLEEEEEAKSIRTTSSSSSDDFLSFYSQEALVEEEEDTMTYPQSVMNINTRAVTTRATSACTSFRYLGDEPSLRVTNNIANFLLHDHKIQEKYRESGKKLESKLVDSNLETKKLEMEEKNKEEIFGDTTTVGSTSKSSSEWRSSIHSQDPGYDPFSSSSRRSSNCPKWDSYTVFQKYDEEMLFLDRVSAQKLQETESFVSSRSSRKKKKKTWSYVYDENSYHELEAAYVAEICLTWEALNWNYNFLIQRLSRCGGSDPGCPAYIAQQFQQFQVLLQRYIETEPYENGRRPLVYARNRSSMHPPKLLQVPEYRDSEEESEKNKVEEYLGSRISSSSFLTIIKEAIKTFMNFLRADKAAADKYRCFFRMVFNNHTKRISTVDPTFLRSLKKLNHKKKLKLKGGGCFGRKVVVAEINNDEMEVLMAEIDLKVVRRVLRSRHVTNQQLRWCEDKMRRLNISNGKLQRDSSSSPLFFPAH